MVLFPCVMNTILKKRITAVEAYLSSKQSLRKTAKRFGISHLTLWRWVKWYKQGGKENLNREENFKPWNRLKPDIEKDIALLKEQNPSLTIFKAQKILSEKGRKISTNGIWSIWKRYGLVGLSKTFGDSDLAAVFFKNTDVVSPKIIKAKELLTSFGKIPFSEYYRKASRLRKDLEEENLYYSAIRVGITETITLTWIAKPEKQLALIHHLNMRAPKRGDSHLKYLLLTGKGIAYAQTLNIEKALNCAKMCRRVLKNLDNVPGLWRELANLYEHIGRFPEAFRIIEKILAGNFGEFEESEREMFYADLSILFATSGKYRECLNTLGKIDKRKIAFRALILMLRAQCLLGEARIYKAQELVRSALEQSKKDEIPGLLHVASLIFAGLSAAMGETNKARNIISRLNPLFKKSKMKKDLFVREMLSSPNYKRIDLKKYPSGVLSHSVCQLVFLLAKAKQTLKLRDYRKAYKYAVTHRLLGLLHRFLLLIPGPVIKVMEKNKSPGLPKQYLQLPVFKKDVPVYRVDFLGSLVIYRHNRLRISLQPKDMAFLIFLALARKQRIPLTEIFQEFWRGSDSPARNLSHVLVRLRKSLKLTTQHLNMEQDNLFCSCRFLTDYEEFENYIAQAKALERTDNWKMAEKEYSRAFLLFREKPFIKMYDAFSEEKRLEVIFKFENNARHFIESLTKNISHRGIDKNELPYVVKKALRKIITIAPDLKACLFESFQI